MWHTSFSCRFVFAKITMTVAFALKQQQCHAMQVAVIKWAGTEQQHVWHATICTVCNKTQGDKLSPCIIVVGQVSQYALPANLD